MSRWTRRAVALSILASAATAIVAGSSCKPTAAGEPKIWHATGAVRTFGPSREWVAIAHDDIPGYMSAMTMSFHAQAPALLDGLAAGDRIAFDFFESEDARRILTRIEKASR